MLANISYLPIIWYQHLQQLLHFIFIFIFLKGKEEMGKNTLQSCYEC